jgi:hypothetical protein
MQDRQQLLQAVSAATAAANSLLVFQLTMQQQKQLGHLWQQHSSLACAS